MTQAQKEMLERATGRAIAAGLEVVGTGYTKDGRRLYCVPSQSEPGRWHVIVVEGNALVCDCTASQYGRYCVHRAATRQRIERERQEEAAHAAAILGAEAAAEEATGQDDGEEWGWVTTPAGDTAYAAYQARQAAQDARETALPAFAFAPAAPFSMFKS